MEKRIGCVDHTVGMATIQETEIVKQSMKRRRILHEWSPRCDVMLLLIVQLHFSLYSVISAKQRALVEKIYSKTMSIRYYTHLLVQVKS